MSTVQSSVNLQHKLSMVSLHQSPSKRAEQKKVKKIKPPMSKSFKDSEEEAKQCTITDRKIDLLTRCKHLELQLKHRTKRHKNVTQKVSKLLFFLHCLQRDHQIPINQIYEEDGFKNLVTHRFHQTLKSFETSFKPQDSQSDNEYSFYSEDSYDPIISKLKYEPSP